MIAFILFQINILTIAALFVICSGRKRSYDGDRDIPLVQPNYAAQSGTGIGGGSSSVIGTPKPKNDDFAIGVPPPHIPLADNKSDDRTLADIESIQSEKAVMKQRGSKPFGTSLSKSAGTPSRSHGATGTTKKTTSPALNF